jgi:hypothetical protein
MRLLVTRGVVPLAVLVLSAGLVLHSAARPPLPPRRPRPTWRDPGAPCRARLPPGGRGKRLAERADATGDRRLPGVATSRADRCCRTGYPRPPRDCRAPEAPPRVGLAHRDRPRPAGRAPRSRADRRARDPRIDGRFRHTDPDRRLPRLPEGAQLLVGSVLRVAPPPHTVACAFPSRRRRLSTRSRSSEFGCESRADR